MELKTMRNSEYSYSRARGDASSRYSLMLKSNMQMSGTYNQVNAISKATKNKIKSDTDILLSAVVQCEKIWKDMRKNDFTTNGILTPAVLERLFKEHEDAVIYSQMIDNQINVVLLQIKELLCVQNAEELLEVLDVEKNGYVNEDGQMLFFSLVRERMERVANDLVILQEYENYKELMREIRKLEAKITVYQDYLRKRIYTNELKLYHEIGSDMVDDFCSRYVNAFKQFDENSLARIEQLNQQHEEEMMKLQEKLEKPESMVKFKPKKMLKELQTQEKLVSIDERVEEAINFRRELTKLEKAEEMRVQQLRFANAEKLIQKLEKEQAKEMEQLRRKVNNEENKLIIQMGKEFDVLKKKTNLHENEIKRIQGLATKHALHKGETESEIKRAKNRSRKQNFIIEDTKKIRREEGNLENSMSPGGTATGRTKSSNRSHMATWALTSLNFSLMNRNTIYELKNINKNGNITKFYIRQQFGKDRPVNKKDIEYETGDNHHKIEKYLLNDKEIRKQTLPSLTKMYDDNLVLQQAHEDNSDRIDAKERRENRKFIQRKIEGGDKRQSPIKI